MITRLQRAIPSGDLQNVFLEMMRTRSDLEIAEREKIRIENQLMKKEA